MKSVMLIALVWASSSDVGNARMRSEREVGLRWLTSGHSIVCEIAWRELTPAAREAIGGLLEHDPEYDSFAASCDWPDTVRGVERFRRYGSTHYVDIAPGADGVSVPRDCQRGMCAIEAIEVFSAWLRDPGTSIEDRLIALKFLGHIVGDLHQPLHAALSSDRGGGLVQVCLPDGKENNLHWVWDEYLVAKRLEATGMTWQEMAAALHADINPVERTLWSATDSRVWANESHAIVLDQVYAGVGEGCLTDDYAVLHAYTIERRFKQAGFRLGALLNDIFG